MKYRIFLILLVSWIFPRSINAQSHEIEQLILNIEKLNQLRSILDNMYKGYTILEKGYNTIKNIAEGNFSLHQVFLDGLLEVSPTVKKYKRVVEIISAQKRLIKEYKSAFSQFKSLDIFSTQEIDYLGQVYASLVERSAKNLDELLMVITSGQLRMNDAERLNAIDRIYADMQDKLQFLRHFNDKAKLLAAQKHKMLQETNDLLRLYGIKE